MSRWKDFDGLTTAAIALSMALLALILCMAVFGR